MAMAMAAVSATAFASPTVPETAQNAVTPVAAVTDLASSFVPKAGIDVSVRYFNPKLSGGVKSDDIKAGGNNSVDLKGTLDFDKKSAPEYIFSYKNMKLDYLHTSNSGDPDLTSAPVTVNSKTFDGKAHTHGKFDYLKLDVTNPIVHVGGIHADWMYGVSMMHWNIKVDGIVGGNHESEKASFTAPVPMVGAKVSAPLATEGSVYASIEGLPLGGYGSVYDAEFGANYTPVSNVSITAGYRIIDVDVHHNNDLANYKLSGPFAGVLVRF